jgi:hypothetical protein
MGLSIRNEFISKNEKIHLLAVSPKTAKKINKLTVENDSENCNSLHRKFSKYHPCNLI